MEYPKPLAQLAADELLRCTPELLAKLRYEWELFCLPHQIPPDWDEFDTWLNVGGRGSGKNTGVTQELRRLVCDEGVMRMNFVGQTAAKVRDDMVRGEAGIIQAFPPHQRPVYVSSQSRVVFHTGCEALLHSAEKPQSLQGGNTEVTWCDEFTTYGDLCEQIWTQVVFSTRVGKPRKIITTNSVPESEFLERLEAEAAERRIKVTRSSSFDNFANLPPATQREVIALANTPLGRAWIFGEYLRIEGALWRKGLWRPGWKPGDRPNGSFRYIPEAPRGGRTVVAVDPTGTLRGDETGIVVVRRVGDFGYVLEDLSGRIDVEVWPSVVLDAADRWGAAAIVFERNVGLDFLRGLMRPAMKGRRQYVLKGIHTDTRKDLRAIPVATQYDLGKIWHVGEHKALETQQTTWNPKAQADLRRANKKMSPNRIDALVHGINALGFHLALAPAGLGGGSLDLESLDDL
jgi:phage terminase large subunit-like protein